MKNGESNTFYHSLLVNISDDSYNREIKPKISRINNIKTVFASKTGKKGTSNPLTTSKE